MMIRTASARTTSPQTMVPTRADAGTGSPSSVRCGSVTAGSAGCAPVASGSGALEVSGVRADPGAGSKLLMSVSFLDGDVADGSVDLHDQPGAGLVSVVAALPRRDAAPLVRTLVKVAQGHVRPDVHRHRGRED